MSKPSLQKRYGMLLPDHTWPLVKDGVLTNPPRAGLSLAPRPGSVAKSMPAAPSMEAAERGSVVLPGFHFSTTDNTVDAAEFHRLAAQLLSGELSGLDTESSSEDATLLSSGAQMHLHCDLGKDYSGRYCCSCGKSYIALARLHEHVRQCAGAQNYPCLSCDMVFHAKLKLDRHVAARHNNHNEACPECGVLFPVNELPKHLASGEGGCDNMVQASVAPAIHQAFKALPTNSPSQKFWTFGGIPYWQQSRPRDSAYLPDEEDHVADQTKAFVDRLLQHPSSEPETVTCDLCGDVFDSQDAALPQHIGEHSLEFAEKRYKCDDCRIFFATKCDLDRHMQSVKLNYHCGLTFQHTSSCTGHHPPTYYKSSISNDHGLMQKHIWAWELSQLRKHRVAVATILAQRMSRMSSNRMSLQDCKRTYISLRPHFAMAKRANAGPSIDPGWTRDQGDELESLDAHFSRIIDEMTPQVALANKHMGKDPNRPDSGIVPNILPGILPGATKLKKERQESNRISMRKSLVDLAKKRSTVAAPVSEPVPDRPKFGHKRGTLSASGFAMLRARASKELNRPRSLPIYQLTA